MYLHNNVLVCTYETYSMILRVCHTVAAAAAAKYSTELYEIIQNHRICIQNMKFNYS